MDYLFRFFLTGFVLTTGGFAFLVPVLASVVVVWFCACCCVDGWGSSRVGSVIFSSHFSSWIVVIGLGGLSLVLVMSSGPAPSAGGSCRIGSVSNFVGEAGGLLGIRFWKQTNN